MDYLLWRPLKQWPSILATSLSHSLALCDKLHKQTTLISNMRPLSHLFHNPEFPPGINMLAFCWWLNKGLFIIGHLFSLNRPFLVQYCMSKLEMAILEKFRFSQITHFLHTIWSIAIRYEQWCSGIMDRRGGISIIYSSLAEKADNPSHAHSWKSDLDIHLDPEE